MIMIFQELTSEEYVLNLVFCFNYFDDSQSVGRWVSGWWVGEKVVSGWWVGGSVGQWSVILIKPKFYTYTN